MDISIVLKRERENQGYTIHSIANKSGINWRTIINMEQGKDFCFSNLIKYLSALDLEIRIVEIDKSEIIDLDLDQIKKEKDNIDLSEIIKDNSFDEDNDGLVNLFGN